MASKDHSDRDPRFISDKPIPLLYTDERTNQLALDEDVLSRLAKIDTELYAVSIVGIMRQGKSYLLNKIGQLTEGFALGHEPDAKTKGIWIYTCPHPEFDGKTLLLLDTEGLGDLMKEDCQNHDNQIFTMALLLCGTLVYNQMGPLNDRSLRELHVVTELSNTIKIGTTPKDKDDYDIYFPTLVLTLRDFTLRMTTSSDEYLDKTLALKEGPPAKTETFNAPRKCLRKYFRERKCFRFLPPVEKPELMYELESVTQDQLTDGFKRTTADFQKYIWSKARPMILPNGNHIKGRMFSNMAREYIQAIIGGKVPCVESTIRYIARIENDKAVGEAVRVYTEKMDARLELLPQDMKTMNDIHLKCAKEAMAVFIDGAVMDEDMEYKTITDDRICKKYEEFKKENETKSVGKCEDVLQHLYQNICDKNRNGMYTVPGGYAVYKNDIDTLQKTYKRTDRLGTEKDTVLQEFIKGKNNEAETIQKADNSLSAAEKDMEKQRLIVEQGKERLALERAVAELREKERQTEKERMESSMTQLQAKQIQEMADQKAHFENVLESRKKEMERLAKEGDARASEEMLQAVNALQQKIEKHDDFHLFNFQVGPLTFRL